MEYHFPPPNDEWSFENFCCRLLNTYWQGSAPERYGQRGEAQDGVDIVDMSGSDPLRAAQCKHKEPGNRLTSAEVHAEVEKAKQFEPPIGHYVILTTARRSTDLQQAELKLNRRHGEEGLFRVRVLAWEAIEEILRDHPGLWDKVVDPPVQRAVAPLREDVAGVDVKIDRLLAESSDGPIDAKLLRVRERLDDHDHQRARLLLRQLRTNCWPEMSGRQRFLTLTYLAQITYAGGSWTEAGKLYLEAEQHLPDEERAKTNKALGLELLGNRDEANELAKKLAAEYPASTRPWAIICRTADETVPAHELQEDLPAQAAADVEVLTALAMRALRQEEWASAEHLASSACRDERDWAAPWLLQGQAKLQIAYRDAFIPAEGPPVLKSSEGLDAAIDLFDKARDIAERTQNDFLFVQATLEQGRARRVAGDDEGAEADIAEAHRRSPRDPFTLLHYGRYLFSEGRTQAAIPLLREASAAEEPDADLFLALALKDEGTPGSSNEWIALASNAALAAR